MTTKKHEDEQETKPQHKVAEHKPHDPTTAPRGQTPTIGRIVHYRLTAENASRITNWRTTKNANWGAVHGGGQAHVGSPVIEGVVFPMILTYVHQHGSVNGQCFLDGNDSWWAFDVSEGDGPGTWSWPPRS